MSGSGAGLNRVFATILTCQPTATALATPLTGYGTIGVNDSGMALNEAMNFTKWSFMLNAGTTGYSISLYGTADPKAYAAWRNAINPGQSNGITLPASAWFLLPGPSEQAGTGAIANPITSTSTMFQFSGSLLAVRAVLTTATTPTGVASINVEAVP